MRKRILYNLFPCSFEKNVRKISKIKARFPIFNGERVLYLFILLKR
jgi:hypothetical protein